MPPKAEGKPAKKPEGATDPISKHKTVVPKKQTIVYQNKRYIYNFAGDEALYAAVTTYLDRVENIEIMHWSNSTSSKQEHSQSYTTGFKTTTGTEVGASIGISATFEGVGISADASTKVITSDEISTTKTKTITVTVPANSDLWLYQRKYVFRTDAFFVLDAWGREWNVGSQGGYHIQHATVVSEVLAEDYVTTNKALKGQGTVEFKGLKQENLGTDTTRKFENCTTRCKDTLTKMGINGTQQD